MGPTRSEGVALESRAAAAPQQPTGPRAPGAASGPRPHPSTSGGDHANVEDVDLDVAGRVGDREQIDKIVSQLNQLLSAVNHQIRFSSSSDAGGMQVLVVDRATGEVVKKIPSDRALQAGANLDELVGLTLDQTS